MYAIRSYYVGALDSAAAKGTIPRKRAARLQGRLARALHKATKATERNNFV